MGLIVNKFLGGTTLSEVIDAELAQDLDGSYKLPVHFGGPVEGGRGYVLHTSDYNSCGSTRNISDAFSLTATLDVIEEIHRETGPELAILAMGCSSWGPGQLEQELMANAWLVAEPDKEVVFIEKDDRKWHAALKKIGVDPQTLSSAAGRA